MQRNSCMTINPALTYHLNMSMQITVNVSNATAQKNARSVQEAARTIQMMTVQYAAVQASATIAAAQEKAEMN